MSIAFAGGAVLDVDDVPDANALPDIEVEEVVRSHSSGSRGSSKYDYLVGFDTGRAMGGSCGGRGSGG